jgi:hypothetical protein
MIATPPSAPWTRAAFGVDHAAGRPPILVKATRRGRRVVFAPAELAELARSPKAAIAACALQRETFLRWITAPIAAPRRAEKVLPSLLDVQLPFSIEDCEHVLLDLQPSPDTGGSRGLMAGIRHADLERRLAGLAADGVDPHVLDPEGMALWSQALEEFPFTPATPPTRVVCHLDADRLTLAIGQAGELLAAHTARHPDPDTVQRILKSALPDAGSAPLWLWTGPGVRDEAATLNLHERLSAGRGAPAKIARDPATFLARALATRALTAGPGRCNLRSRRFLHPIPRRYQDRQPYRLAAWGLAAGLFLCAVNLTWQVAARHRTADANKTLRALAAQVMGTGHPLPPRGQEVLLAQRFVADQTRALDAFLAARKDPLPGLLQTLLGVAREEGLTLETLTLKRDALVIHGLTPKWAQAEKAAGRLASPTWSALAERKETPPGEERAAFIISMGRNREKP